MHLHSCRTGGMQRSGESKTLLNDSCTSNRARKHILRIFLISVADLKKVTGQIFKIKARVYLSHFHNNNILVINCFN